MERYLDKRAARHNGCDPYVLSRRHSVPEYEEIIEKHGREWWLKQGDNLNLGSGKWSKNWLQSGDDRVEKQHLDRYSTCSCHSLNTAFCRSITRCHTKWISELPVHLQPFAPSEPAFALWRPFFKMPVSTRRQWGCGCVHHRSFTSLATAIELGRKQGDMHKSKRIRPHTDPCSYGDTCSCVCAVCTASDTSASYLHRAVCEPAQNELPALSCVYGKCCSCGFARLLDCPTEVEVGKHLAVKARKYVKVTTEIPGHKSKTSVKLVAVTQRLSKWKQEAADLFPFTLIHDYMDRRIQRVYKRIQKRLQLDEELWIMDFIENFTCFEEFELYQDHYCHEAVTIFIILVIRNREPHEQLMPGTATFSLPENLTAEMHTFISADKKHDAFFAQKCMMRLLEFKKARGKLKKRYILLSDGGPAHFKMLRQLAFITLLSMLWGDIMFWWIFFQSCHGRGMQDGAGNWVKSAVAMACLSGQGISDAIDFFMYCIEHLRENKSQHNFTSERHFHLVSLDEIAAYRATQPAHVTGKKHIKPTKADYTGWFFFAVSGTLNQIIQRRSPCECDMCYSNRFSECERKNEDTLEGDCFNLNPINNNPNTNLNHSMLCTFSSNLIARRVVE